MSDGRGAEANKEEEEMVVTNPKLARLIYHSCNIAFVLEVIFFIIHVAIYYKASGGVWWQVLLASAIISPLFILPLYCMAVLRDEFIKIYAMAPFPDKIHGDLSCKLLASDSEKV